MTDTSRMAKLMAARLKSDAGERLTRAERSALWIELVEVLDAEISALLNDAKPRAAIRKALFLVVSSALGQADRADRLEDRIAALEAAAKAAPARSEDGLRLAAVGKP